MKDRGRTAFIVSFLAPAGSIYGLFVLVPLVQAVQFSLYNWSGVAGNAKPVGLKNFFDLFGDNVFRRAVGNNLLLAGVGGLVTMVLALLVAHMVQGSGRVQRALRACYLLPHITSLVAVSVLWIFMFNPIYGPFTAVLKSTGLIHGPFPWLGDKKTALPCVGLTFVWYVLGFYVMLFASGIQSISHEVYEAAELDGSRGFHRFKKITWPLLFSIKRMAILNYVIAAMNTFALVFLMTSGGPDRSSEVTMTYLYEQSFTNSNMGYGSAIAVLNMIVVSILVGIILLFFRRSRARGATS